MDINIILTTEHINTQARNLSENIRRIRMNEGKVLNDGIYRGYWAAYFGCSRQYYFNNGHRMRNNML